MSHTPTFSIIMPAYNSATTIANSIKSVLRQSLLEWELIIIDDGSTDDTEKVVTSSFGSDPRIHLIQQANAGPSAARNNGLARARGKFIAFLDADDLWHPDRLRGIQMAFDDSPQTGVFFSRTQFIDQDGTRLRTVTRHFPNLSLETLLSENPLCSTSNIVSRREVFDEIGRFVKGLDFAEDQDWLVRTAADGRWKIQGIDKVWFYYRSSPNSQSSDLDAMHAGWVNLRDRAGEISPEQVSLIEKQAYAVFCRQLARRAIRKGAKAAAIWSWLAKAIKSDPHIVFKQPRRTGLTLAGAIVSLLPIQQLNRYAQQ